MTTAIPELTEDVPGAPRDVTRNYFDTRSAFGARHARPATGPTVDRIWSDDELLDAAHVGAEERDLHLDLLSALCRRYVDLVQDDTSAADEMRLLRQRIATVQGIAAALSSELTGERLERNRLAELHAEASKRLAEVVKLHARLSVENVHLRHQLAGTTPVSVEIALDRSAREAAGSGAEVRRYPIDARFDDGGEGTEVVDLRLAGGAR